MQLDRSSEFDQTARHDHRPNRVCQTCGLDQDGHKTLGIGDNADHISAAGTAAENAELLRRLGDLQTRCDRLTYENAVLRNRIIGFERLSGRLATEVDRLTEGVSRSLSMAIID